MKSFCHGVYLDFKYIHGTQKVVWEGTWQSKANQTCFRAERLPHITLNYAKYFYAHTQNRVNPLYTVANLTRLMPGITLAANEGHEEDGQHHIQNHRIQ